LSSKLGDKLADSESNLIVSIAFILKIIYIIQHSFNILE